MSKKTKIIISILAVIAVLISTAGIAFNAYYKKINYQKADSTTISSEEKEQYNREQQDENLVDSNEEDIKKMEQEIMDNIQSNSIDIPYNNDVLNILLIGTDDREDVQGSRSDSMILCSLNKKTKEITLTSLMRDCYVEIPDHGNNRLNAAYAFGGTQLLIDTIEQNFKIDIDRYVKVNFFSFMDIVDAIGGVDIDLSDDEIRVLNLYLGEVNEILDEEGTDAISGPAGVYHLNGKQALAYSRNRYTGNSDFSRTERQRNVLNAIKESVKNSSIIELNNLLNVILPYITTDLTKGECFSLLLDAPSYLSNEMTSSRIPYDGTFTNVTINKMAVLSLDFKKNIERLHSDIYGITEE